MSKLFKSLRGILSDEQKRAHKTLYAELVQLCESSVKRSLSVQESLVLRSMSNEQLAVLNDLMKEAEHEPQPAP